MARHLLSVAFLLTAATARAEPPPVALVYRAAPDSGCPDREAIAAGVIGRLGRDPFVAGAPRRIEVTVLLDGGSRRALLTIVDGDAPAGGRMLESTRPTCAELGEEIELAIAIAVDPTVAPVAPAAPAIAPAAGPPAPPALPPPSARTALEVGLLVTEGTAPGRAAGFALGLRRERAGFSLGGEVRLDRAGERALGAMATIDGDLAALGALGCRHLDLVTMCGVLQAGRLRHRGVGVTEGGETSTPFAALGARVALTAPVASLSLALVADVLVATTRAEIVVDERVAWTSARVPLALGVRLGVPL